jgi:HSP20 family protein
MFILPLTHTLSRRAGFYPVWSRAVERLLDERVDRFPAAAQLPAMDIAESDAGYTLSFDLPGISKEQVKVSIEGRSVSVEASQGDEADSKDSERVVHRERSVTRFARKVSLPVELDAAASQARFENGVLTLTVAKKVADAARQLTIQ